MSAFSNLAQVDCEISNPLGNKINCSFEIQQIVDYSVIKFKTLRPRTVYWTNMYSLALQ